MGVTEVPHMSSPSITDLPSAPTDVDDGSLVQAIVTPLHRLAFWAAIALPFLHLPLLVSGLDSETRILAFVALLACNVLALLVGHPDRVG
ncbi:MAG: hypothetical protein V5A39_13960 [Haloarculaceae archaeon]